MLKINSPKQVYEAFRKGLMNRTEDWKDLVAEEVTVKAPFVHLKGKKQFVAVYEAYYEKMGVNVVHKLVEQGDLVITQISVTRAAQNDQLVTLDINQWYTIRNGKIENVTLYFDASALNDLDKSRYRDSVYK